MVLVLEIFARNIFIAASAYLTKFHDPNQTIAQN